MKLIANLCGFLTFTLLFSFGFTQTLPPVNPNYEVVFEDEFDSIYNGNEQVDVSKWIIPSAWGNTSVTYDKCECFGDSTYCDSLNSIPGGNPYIWPIAYGVDDANDTSNYQIDTLGSGLLKLKTDKENYLGTLYEYPLVCDTDTVIINNVTTYLYYGCNGLLFLNDSGPYQNGTCFTAFDTTYFYTTGQLFSRNKFKYGYFEIRFKFPVLPNYPANYNGHGPTFWMYDVQEDIGVKWSEIDIFEMLAEDTIIHPDKRNYYNSTVHFSNCDCEWSHPTSHIGYGNLEGGVWHKAAVWWQTGKIDFFLDDSLYFTVIDGESTSNGIMRTDSLVPMPMIIGSSAPAATLCSNFDSINGLFPYIYEIDYVRVYQLKQECDSIKNYCDISSNDLQNKLYEKINFGGIGCTTDLSTTNSKIQMASTSIFLEDGVVFDGSGSLSLEITPCLFNQTRQSNLPIFPMAPSKSWKTKFGIK